MLNPDPTKRHTDNYWLLDKVMLLVTTGSPYAMLMSVGKVANIVSSLIIS